MFYLFDMLQTQVYSHPVLTCEGNTTMCFFVGHATDVDVLFLASSASAVRT